MLHPFFRCGLAIFALTGTLLTGCVAVRDAADNTSAYVRGALESNVEASLARTFKATNKAIEELRFAEISSASDALSGKVVARTAQDKKIEIKLNRVTETLTSIDIRVGTFGDEALSTQILTAIKRHL